MERHKPNEAHRVSEELRHGDFKDARNELQHEAHHPQAFKKMVDKVNKELKEHHQSPLSIQHDKHGNISHLHFGKHDVYDKHHEQHHHHKKHLKHHPAGTPSEGEPGKPKTKPDAPQEPPTKPADAPYENKFLDPQQRAEAALRDKAADKPAEQPYENKFLDPQQKAEAALRAKQ